MNELTYHFFSPNFIQIHFHANEIDLAQQFSSFPHSNRTGFLYALYNLPEAIRPFVYLHWLNFPLLKFERPDLSACFGLFRGIQRTKYIPFRSPYSGISVCLFFFNLKYL